MAAKVLFITGTDTGVGKSVVTALLAREWLRRGVRVAALKPICSGGRDDARLLHKALQGALPLDQINPWHFQAALAPSLAARREGTGVTLVEVVRHVRQVAGSHEVVIVEGAGGLLSPLGRDFDSRDLLKTLGAIPIVVAPNRLGVVGQVRMTIECFPRKLRTSVQVVLSQPLAPDASSASNPRLLAEHFTASQIHVLPQLIESGLSMKTPPSKSVIHALGRLLKQLDAQA